MKVSAYVDLLWDRSDLQKEIDRWPDNLPLLRVFDERLIHTFFSDLKTNDALLRKAIDAASLYLPRNTRRVSNVTSVIPVDDEGGPMRQIERRVQGTEKRETLVQITERVLRNDFLVGSNALRPLVVLFAILSIPLGPPPEERSEGQEKKRPDENPGVLFYP